MAVSARLVRRRIKSVGNTKKITKAMELVSAAKMRRAIAAATNARRYTELGSALLSRLSSYGTRETYPLMTDGTGTRELYIVIASDRGLCGGYNAQVLRTFESAVNTKNNIDCIAVGNVAEAYLRRTARTVIASFPGRTVSPTAHEVRPIISLATSEFISHTYASVYVVATQFKSALRQVPHVFRLLPLAPITPTVATESALIEPRAKEVLEYTLPRFIEAVALQALLEAAASEHSARMMSMRSASDAASDMIDDLTFTLNQARQSAITSEIAEISAGRAALEN